MTGSLPSLVCTQACRQPVRTRCGVMTHQARAISRCRDGGQASPAASRTSPTAAIAMSQAAPSAYPLASATVASPADRPNSYRQFQISPKIPGRGTLLSALSTLAMTLGSFGRRGRPKAMASSPPRG